MIFIKNRDRGILLILISSFFSALTLTLIKLGGNVPVYEKSFLRNVCTIIVASIILKKAGARFFGHKGNRKLLLIRSVSGTLAVWTSYYALSHMLISNATILTNLSPIFAIIFAAIFLKENIKGVHIIAFIIAFLGVLFVVKPTGHSYSLLPSAIAIFSAVIAAIVVTCIRLLGTRENPRTVVFFYAMVSMILSTVLMLFHFQMPTLKELVILLLAGVSSTLTQYSITFAYKFAPANEISIYNYSSIIFVTLLGFIIWGNLPDYIAIIGYVLIISGALIPSLFLKTSK